MENPEQITILTRSSSLNVEINSQPDNPPTYEEAVANTSPQVESWSTKSTDDKEDFLETTLPTIEFENQFSVIDLKFYIRYKEYLDNKLPQPFSCWNVIVGTCYYIEEKVMRMILNLQ
ncbi:6661_t:CDS:2 [Dentiscutata erythropus]|uniref:6661_t:CDS:1 n=1 Tax=Dentiscutata erythropus TaxID=1348616 RepID=A0A9N8WJJ6_9GLOM|nr:6661_t:CDS:2 [Dentiscutata erythropus]